MTQAVRKPAVNLRALGVGVLAALLVPFAVTGMFRNDLSDQAVVIVCLVVGAALLVRRGLPRAAGIGWLTGCVLDAAFMLWLFSVMGDGLSDF